jgi:hypothetical protein
MVRVVAGWDETFGENIQNVTGDRSCIGFTYFAKDMKWKVECPYETILSEEKAPTEPNGKFHRSCKGPAEQS